ncbi:MAG: UMP kinase [Anaerolineae bacterium]|nr:UMP kinase [Anaerolineae bacterium]
MGEEAQKIRRVLLKISGEALAPEQGVAGIDPQSANFIAQRVKEVYNLGIDVGIVIGGGNLWRGRDQMANGMDRANADYIGMLATIMNALTLMDALEAIGVMTRVQTSIEMSAVAEPYIRRRAIRHMEKRRVVIFGGGTGNPYFSTDTAAALRAMEIAADVLIKATKVDGVYDSDPKVNPEAKRFETITFIDALQRRLSVMDGPALSLCMENNLPVLVLNLWEKDALKNAVSGDMSIGTWIRNDE